MQRNKNKMKIKIENHFGPLHWFIEELYGGA